MHKGHLYRINGNIIRVLEESDEGLLVIDAYPTIRTPRHVHISELQDALELSEEDLFSITKIEPRNNLSAKEVAICQHRFTLISPILPCLNDDKTRCKAIANAAKINRCSKRRITNYLYLFLAYNNKNILAPKEKKIKTLSDDEKNFRWALNRFFYTRFGKNIPETYTMLIKEKYCDSMGKILPHHPTLHQFRYYYKRHRSLQTTLISRNGIKDYQMNHRPLLGDSVQQFAPCVGTGMLDATVCDIYLKDEFGNVVGRPILTVCIDAYSGMCLGYSLSWEGGIYSVRSMFLNVVSDKVEFCKKMGILIQKSDWNCSGEIPATIVTDKGSEYISENLAQLSELGCSVVNLPAYRPELKSMVEKFFDLIQNDFKHLLKGKGIIEEDFQERGGHDYRKDACLTLNDFEKVIVHSILFHNTKRIKSAFPFTEAMLTEGISPYANTIWIYGKQQNAANLIKVSAEHLMKVLMPRTMGRFARNGLLVNGLRYHCEGFVEEYLTGGKALVCYNPEDVSYVYLVEKNYCKFNLIDSRFLSKSLYEVTEFKHQQRNLAKSCAEENLQAKVDFVRHIEAISAGKKPSSNANIKDMNQTKKIERSLAHKDFIKEAANG